MKNQELFRKVLAKQIRIARNKSGKSQLDVLTETNINIAWACPRPWNTGKHASK